MNLHESLDMNEAESNFVIGEQTGQIVLTEREHEVERRAIPVVLGGWKLILKFWILKK